MPNFFQTVQSVLSNQKYVSNVISENTSEFIASPQKNKVLILNDSKKLVYTWQFATGFFFFPYIHMGKDNTSFSIIDLSLAMINIIRIPFKILSSAFYKKHDDSFRVSSISSFLLQVLIALALAVTLIVAVITRAFASMLVAGISCYAEAQINNRSLSA